MKGNKSVSKKLLALFGLALLLTACVQTDSQEDGEYISVSEVYSKPEGEYAPLVVRMSTFDIVTESMTAQMENEYVSDYFNGVVDLTDEVVYFVRDTDDGSALKEQIFQYDLNSRVEERLTDDFVRTRQLIPTRDKVFFAATLWDMDGIRLGFYDKTTKELHYWNEDLDRQVECFCVDEANQKIYVATYSRKESEENSSKLGDEDQAESEAPIYTVWEVDFDFAQEKELFTERSKWIRMLLVSENRLLMLYDEKAGVDKPFKAMEYDLQAKTRSDFALPPFGIRCAAFSRDGESLYVVSLLPDSPSKLYEYRIEDEACTLLYEAKANEVIDSIFVR